MKSRSRTALAAALLAAAGLGATSQAQDFESLLPEGTIAYSGTGDLSAFLAEAKSKAAGKILREQEVQDFLEEPMQQIHGMLQMGIAQAQQTPALQDIDLNPQTLFGGPFGRTFFALTHLTLPAEPGAAPDVGMVVGLEAGQGATDLLGLLQGVVQSLAASDGVELDIATVEVGSASYQRTLFQDDEAPPLCFAKIGNLSVLSLSEKSIHGMLQCAAGAAGISGSADIQAAQAVVGKPPAKSMHGYANTAGLVGILEDGLKIAQQHAGENDAREIGMVLQALDFSELRKMGATYTVSGYDGDVSVMRSYQSLDPQAGGLVKAIRALMGPIDKDLVNLIPSSALSFSLANFDIAPLYDTCLEGLRVVAPEAHAMAMMQLQGFAAQVGGTDADGNPLWDLRRDLIGAVGGSFFSMTTPGAATMFGPANNTVAFFGCKNAAGLERSLSLLIALPGQMAGFPLQFNASDHNGVTMHTLDASALGPAAAMAAMIQPTYAIHGGRFYMASSPKSLGGFLDSMAQPPAENVTQRADFARHFSKMPQDATYLSLAYGDTKTNFENLYNTLLGTVPMAIAMMPEAQDLPIDLSLLPTAEAISQHLFGSVSANFEAGPGVYVTEVRSPFGIEAGLALAGLVGGGMAIFGMRQQAAAQAEWEVAETVAVGPEAQAEDDLSNLSIAIVVYTVEVGSPPNSLEELTAAKPGYPTGFLPTTQVPTDPWGNAYHYSVDESGETKVWSSGPNGVNENGGGDDLASN